MRIFCTGQVGLEKGPFLDEAATIARGRGHQVKVFHVGQMMAQLDPKIPLAKILNIDYHRLDFLARTAYERVNEQSKSHANVIVNAHATFRWRFGLFRAFDINILRAFRPDILATAIENCHEVKASLLREKDKKARSFTLKDVLIWREEEIMTTDIFAEALSSRSHTVRHYVLAKGLGVETWARLFFEPKWKKVYASYPITQIQGNKKAQKEKEGFLSLLRKHFVVFDPFAISERKLISEADNALDTRKILQMPTAKGELRIDIGEIDLVRQDIDGQIISRDFKLIDQADFVCAFIPLIDGHPSISAGVERELQHAHETGKDTYILCNRPGKLSPFTAIPATAIFSAEAELENWAVQQTSKR